MAKFRTLSKDELESLEKEFIDFLILNSITSQEWVNIKSNEKDKAEKIIELFSDVVFTKVLRSVNFLDHYSKHSIRSFHCLDDHISLIGMETDDSSYDFCTADGINLAKNHPPDDLRIYTSTKSYFPDRETEIFKMIQAGCQISKGGLYRQLTDIKD